MRTARYIVAILLLATSFVKGTDGVGDKSAAAVARTIAPFVDEETIILIRVDFARIDLDALQAKWRQLVTGDGYTQAAEAMAPVARYIRGFRELGLKDVIYVTGTSDMVGWEPSAVIPLHAGAKPEVLKALIESTFDSSATTPRPPMEERVGLLPGPKAVSIGRSIVCGTAEHIGRFRTTEPTHRPELARALAAAGPADIQVLLLPTAESRRVIEEIMPQLPPLLGGGPSTVLTHGVRWAALSIDMPPGLSARVVIQSRDTAAAKALDEYMPKLVQGLLDAATAAAKAKPDHPNLAPLVRLITPARSADRLALTLDERQINNVVEEIVTPLLREGQKAARQMTSASNLRQIGVASYQYGQQHKGQWPPDLRALKKYGITDQVLKNPRQPKRKIGYVYVRPARKVSPRASTDTLIAYEVHDEWGDGINVLYADGHVEFVTNEARFRKELAAAKAASAVLNTPVGPARWPLKSASPRTAR